jgi:hypothetical protein
MIALLGPPPPNLLARANLKSKFFSETGKLSVDQRWLQELQVFEHFIGFWKFPGEWNAGIPIPPKETFEEIESTLLSEGDMKDRKLFLQFMRKMLQWEPEKRSRAKDLAKDEWIVKHTS